MPDSSDSRRARDRALAASGGGRSHVVFIAPFPLSEHDAKVLGFRAFRQRGIEVEVLVVPVMPGSPRSGPNSVDTVPIAYVGDPSEIDRAIEVRAQTAVFFDFAFGLTPPTLRAAREEN